MSPAPSAAGPAAWLFGPSRGARARRLFLLVAFPSLVLVGTLAFDFVFDDNLVILEDPLITGPLNLQAIFGSAVRVMDVTLGYYRPLITLLYRADWTMWGKNPAGYHLTSLLLHVATTLLVYRVTLRTTGHLAGAWIAAMLFGVLPAHTEAVGWIQGRVDLASTALVLLSLLALLRSRDARGRAAWGWGGLAGVAFLLALLAKESAAVLLLAWAVWEFSAAQGQRLRQHLASCLIRFVPLVAAGLLYWWLRQAAVGTFVGFPLSLAPVPQRALGLLAMLGEYGRALLLPKPALQFFTSFRADSAPGAAALGGLAALGLGGGLLATWRRARHLFPWVAWLPIMLLPPLLFVLNASAPETGFYTAERFLYGPSVGWCILAGVLIGRALVAEAPRVGPRWSGVGLAALIVGYASLTLVRLLPWADPVALYVAMQGQADLPLSVRVLVHNNLGQVYLEQGQFAAAREELSVALRLDPSYALAHNNMGALLIRGGRPAEAFPWLETAIRLSPAYGDAYANLGAAHEALGELAAAQAAYEAGLSRVPGSPRLVAGLHRVRRAQGRTASGAPGTTP